MKSGGMSSRVGGFANSGRTVAREAPERTARSDTSGVVRTPGKAPVASVVPAAARMAAAMVDPYETAASEARMSANSFKPDTPDHQMFNDAWDHAVLKKPRPQMLDRSHPAWLGGVTNGLQYARYNPRKIVAD